LTFAASARSARIHDISHLLLSDVQVDLLSMVGVTGSKFPAIRQHLDQNIGGAYKDMDTRYALVPAVDVKIVKLPAAFPRSPLKTRLTPRPVSEHR
jgi:hypothetical protein